MKAVSNCVLVMLITLPALASASYEILSFSCSSTLLVLQVNGLLNIGKQSIITAPDIRLIANAVNIQGRLNAIGGSVEMNAENSAQMTSSAIVDLRNKLLYRPVNMNNRWDVQ